MYKANDNMIISNQFLKEVEHNFTIFLSGFKIKIVTSPLLDAGHLPVPDSAVCLALGLFHYLPAPGTLPSPPQFLL